MNRRRIVPATRRIAVPSTARRRAVRSAARCTAVRSLVAAGALAALGIGLGGPAGATIAAVPDGAPARSAATATPSAPSAPPDLGGWNISADGNPVDLLIDNTTGLAGLHPLTEADIPQAQSQFETGPFGSALADVFWPGNAGANFGSLAPELGLPPSLTPISSKLNDPVRATAQYPSGPATATYPPGAPGGVAEMQSTASAGGSAATAAIVDQTAAKVFGFSSIKGSSSAVADSTARANSSADLTDVSLLGGLIRIGSITSTASAISDGNTGHGSATTHIGEVTVLGQPASIGSDGLVLPSLAQPLGPIVGPVAQNALSQVITALGITIKEFPSSQSQDGAGYTTTSGGLSVEIVPPSSAAPLLEQAASTLSPLFPGQAAIIPTLPGLLQGLDITLTLGRATASANASPPFNDSFNPPPFPTATGSGTTGATSSGGTAIASGSGAVPVASGGGTVPVSTGSGSSSGPSLATTGGATAAGTGAAPGPATAASAVPVSTGPATLVDLTTPLGAGTVLLGLLAALGLGYGLWKLGRTILPGDAAPVCPLGQDAP